jgi:hypothetical protein
VNGEIAQILALTCFGNDYLSGQSIPRFLPANSTCESCNELHFVLVKQALFGKLREKEIAKTPDDWFIYF